MGHQNWRTHQMSGHLLMWQEFRVNFADEYLQGIARLGSSE